MHRSDVRGRLSTIRSSPKNEIRKDRVSAALSGGTVLFVQAIQLYLRSSNGASDHLKSGLAPERPASTRVAAHLGMLLVQPYEPAFRNAECRCGRRGIRFRRLIGFHGFRWNCFSRDVHDDLWPGCLPRVTFAAPCMPYPALAVSALPHSRQAALERDVIPPQLGHILCDPRAGNCGFNLRLT